MFTILRENIKSKYGPELWWKPTDKERGKTLPWEYGVEY